MERKLLQIAFALAGLMAVIGRGGPTIGIMIGLAGELIFAPLLWFWQRHVDWLAQHSAPT